MAIKDEQNRWIDPSGNAIPAKYIDPVLKDRDRVVCKLVKKAERVHQLIAELKTLSFDDIEKYLENTEKRYGVSEKTSEGNKCLTDFSGRQKVEIKVHKDLKFDDRLSLAKSLIDGCLKRWSKNADDKIKMIVDRTFRVDKKGNVDRDRVLELREHKFKDQDWIKAMEIIADSLQVVGSRRYITFAKKNDNGPWESIALDISRC